MSIRAMASVWERSQQEGGALLVLLALADFAHDDGTGAYPSIAVLAQKARMSVRNVQYCLRKLEREGEVSRRPGAGPHDTSVYSLTLADGEPGAKSAPVKKVRGAKSAPVQPIAPGGCNPLHQGGAKHDILEVQPIAPKPSVKPSWEPSIEPSVDDRARPLLQSLGIAPDQRTAAALVKIVEAYPTVDHDIEAACCGDWCQKKKRTPNVATYRNWVKRAAEDRANGNGRQARQTVDAGGRGPDREDEAATGREDERGRIERRMLDNAKRNAPEFWARLQARRESSADVSGVRVAGGGDGARLAADGSARPEREDGDDGRNGSVPVVFGGRAATAPLRDVPATHV